ncbi:MAG: IclR family transcriptional regulator [Sphingomonas sp.]
MTEAPKYRAPALQKGLQILETLAHASGPMSMSDISTALARSRNEIFRMLQVLEDMGYIARNNAGAYLLTNRLFALGMQQPPVRDLLAHAMPHMNALAEALGQSCHLAVASGADMVVIARVESPGMLGFAVRVGHRRPLHRSASGELLMAHQSDRALDTMIADIEAAYGTIDRAALEDALRGIRDAGYVALNSAVITAVEDLSAPVLVQGAAVAALTVPFVGGASAQVTVDEAIARLRETASRLSHELEGTRLE